MPTGTRTLTEDDLGLEPEIPETMWYRFWGSSDDLIEVETLDDDDGWVAVDEFYANGQDRALFELEWSNEEGVHVGNLITAEYMSSGTWAFGIAPMDEGTEFVVGIIRVEMAENGYSTVLQVLVPVGTMLERADTG